MKEYTQLSYQERFVIFKGIQDGFSIRDMAKHLGRNPGTISRELKRNKYNGIGYLPDSAHFKTSSRKIGCNKQPLKSPKIYKYVISKLKLLWSPQQISNRIKIDLPGCSIHYETIYSYIYSKKAGHLKLYRYLRFARKRRRKKLGRRPQRTLIPCRTLITERPESVNDRKEVGHWEADTIVFAGRKSAVLVNVERATRYTLAVKLKDMTSESVKNVFLSNFSEIPGQLKKTITTDNGHEFVRHIEITKSLNMPFYFCHPYSSWERGTIENTNGLIRQYLPKYFDLKSINQDKIDKMINQLNNRPRKCLNYMTPNEVFNRHKGVALQNRI